MSVQTEIVVQEHTETALVIRADEEEVEALLNNCRHSDQSER